MTALVKRRGPLIELRRSAAGDLAIGLVLLFVAAGCLGYPLRFTAQAAGAFLLVSIAIILFLPRHLPLRAFGAANRITLLRAGLVALLVGLVGQTQPDAWLPAIIGVCAVALDGLDGWMARRRGLCSRFGARFDMEVDALLILVLAALVLELDKAGPWVLAAGALRYLFLAAQWVFPALQRPLPPSRRRQSLCVLQMLILVVCLCPPTTAPLSAFLAAGALALLTLSFAIDLAWLARRAGPTGETR